MIDFFESKKNNADTESQYDEDEYDEEPVSDEEPAEEIE